MSRGGLYGLAALFVAVLASAVGVVHAKYESRRLFVELQGLREARDLTDIEWGRLQLELGTWGTHARVEKMARARLGMRQPQPGDVVVIRRQP
ncbi:MAG: cell division protein FtsL [Gammaproteobacteria bacterium]